MTVQEAKSMFITMCKRYEVEPFYINTVFTSMGNLTP